ncbi:MAG: arylsulfatase [Planctomycetota bacterium]
MNCRCLVACLIVGTTLVQFAALVPTASAAENNTRPNILVILTDDLGYSDLGCYGSEIDTPNLDRLAAGGLRFTQFYNTAKCHSSRVSLLTGRWCRQAGDQSLRRAVTIPEILTGAGYFTAMTGKWHLSKQPTDFGFDRYFGHLSGACNYYRGDNSFRLNGQPWTVPSEGFYTTVANVDHALGFLDEARVAKKPWFLYVAFNAPHAPLQPLEQDYKKYLGRYDAGWDAMRAARVAKQKSLNLFGSEVEPAPRPEHISAWDALSPELRAWEARRMAAYAALIDRVDQELGRLLKDLNERGELENTLVLFFSDNGACPYDRRSIAADREPYEPDVTWSDSTGWAWARNTPFRYYKQNQFEGGIASPAIMHWPAGLKAEPGSLVHSPAHLVDVLPTLADITQTKLPQSWPDRELSPVAGISLAPILAGRQIPSRPPIHLLFSSDRGLRDGDWKIVSFRSQPWELYNLAQDRTELRNLAAEHPEILDRMVKLWHQMSEEVLGAPAKETAPVAATAGQQRHPEWTDFSNPNAGEERRAARKGKAKAGRKGGKAAADGSTALPRARKGTRLSVEEGQLVLDCSGDDPGLAFDRLPALTTAGPYTLEFRVQSRASGGGEVYWTTDPETTLPNGEHLAFEVTHDGNWHSIKLSIQEPKVLHAFRLDPCAGAGEVRLEAIQLKGADGTVLHQWP